MQELQQTGDDTKLHPAQDPGEERPSIDLAPGVRWGGWELCDSCMSISDETWTCVDTQFQEVFINK